MNFNVDDLYVEEICQHFKSERIENEELILFMALQILKFENYNILLSIERLRKYIKWRKKLFGNLNNHSLDDDLILKRQIETCFVQFHSQRCENGEMFMYIELAKHDPNQFNAFQTVKCCHYMILSALKADPDLCHIGCIVLINVSNVRLVNVDLKVPSLIASVIDCMPLKLINGIVFNPPHAVKYLIPIVMMIVPTILKPKIHIIYDISELTNLNINISHLLPIKFGGNWTQYTSTSHLQYYQLLNFNV